MPVPVPAVWKTTKYSKLYVVYAASVKPSPVVGWSDVEPEAFAESVLRTVVRLLGPAGPVGPVGPCAPVAPAGP
jgi:hypothetical protein